ncbi:hypothetical protein [Okeania sp. SIO1I7]|uniref:hypothetical protein n=1 Tax=Okeania sp. SIO1I7 TaxID=2607772 RepID=UPI0013FAF88C|nr:hypothetical protein [Okeania sp. SIO1I7]NET26677.1 hypothetical protein [Okeania sp. SIO1I7]
MKALYIKDLTEYAASQLGKIYVYQYKSIFWVVWGKIFSTKKGNRSNKGKFSSTKINWPPKKAIARLIINLIQEII